LTGLPTPTDHPTVETQWLAVLDTIRASVTDSVFGMLFREMWLADFSADRAVIGVPNQSVANMIESHAEYRSVVANGLRTVIGHDVPYKLTAPPAPSDPAIATIPTAPTVATATAVSATARSTSEITAPQDTPPPFLSPSVHGGLADAPQNELLGEPMRPNTQSLHLLPHFTFDNFIVGKSNELAYAAARAIAEKPGRVYNPLYVYGSVGLGKTHLLQAVCHEVRARDPDARIHFLSAEQFENQYVVSLRSKMPESFRAKFRNCDMLVIDDLQFIQNKTYSIEELFHTFNDLNNRFKQLIFSADGVPETIEVHQRLRSRLKSGLVVHVEPPGYETRVAIIQGKCEIRNVHLPEDVIAFVAERVTSNIRELEGAVNSVINHAMARGSISVEVAEEALSGIAQARSAVVTITQIVELVAAHYNVPVKEMESTRRSQHIALPRQVAMFLIRQFTHYSLDRIGEAFSGRDHSTVLHSIGKIEKQVKEDPELRAAVDTLSRQIARGK
jgi:chromosomal replication initiator protein